MAKDLIQAAQAANKPAEKAKNNINTMLNSILDGENMRKRFSEILAERTPQFISSLVAMINGTPALQECFYSDPMSVVQSALKCATYDLPLGMDYAYIVPFNSKDANGNYKKSATFLLGYKGMIQLCLRTGAYSRIPDAVDVRQGELISYDRLTGDCEFSWIADEEEREKRPVIGYAGYFRLKNGAEKTLFMTIGQIKAHEEKNRKGKYQNSTWKDNFDAMARKTVIRKLCGTYGLMSIQYQNGDKATVQMAEAIANDDYSEIESTVIVDAGTGAVIEDNGAV